MGRDVFLVGTSGWSYDDWVGPVYPEDTAQRKGAWLELYAQRFGAVEVNSTFYRLPSDRVVEGWVEKTARLGGDFEFSLKAPQELTHEAMVQGDRAMTKDLLEQLQLVVLEPLARARRLGAVLLQLSPRFHGGEDQLRMLELALRSVPAGVDVAVEFRHRTWVEGRNLAPAAMDLLQETGAALCAVDGPSFPPMTRATGKHAYVRFHGRRADAWFAKGKERTTEDDLPARYDYRYTKDELEPWARVLQDNAPRHERVRVFFNNHPRGQAVANAEEMMVLLGVEPPRRTQSPKPRGRKEPKLADFG